MTERPINELVHQAEDVYLRSVLAGRTTDQIQAEIRQAVPKLHALEARRIAMGWTRKQVLTAATIALRDDQGLRLSLRESDLYDYERKERAPGREYVDLLCRVFRCSAADIGYPEFSADHRDTQNKEIRTTKGYPRNESSILDEAARGAAVVYVGQLQRFGIGAERYVLQVDGRYVIVDRRTFLNLTAAVPGAAFLSPFAGLLGPDGRGRVAGAITGVGSVDRSLVRDLRQMLDVSRRMDDRAGPRDLLEAMAGEVRMVERLIPRATETAERPLLSVAGEMAQFAGWLALDSGDFAGALRYYDQGRDWALAAANWSLASYLDAFRADHAIVTRDPNTAIVRAKAAQHQAGPVHPAVLAWAVRTEARAHALDGNEQACTAKLVEAERLLGNADTADAPPLIYHFTHDSLIIYRGSCFRDLGRAQEAIDTYTEGLAKLPADCVRDRGLYLTRRASAHTLAKQPDEAAADIMQSFPLAIETGSGRTIDEIRGVRAALHPWRGTSAIKELDDLIGSAA